MQQKQYWIYWRISKLNKYQVTHYWSDENTFATTICQTIHKAKNEDNVINIIKKCESKEIRQEIYDMGCYPTNIGINLYFDEYGNELTAEEYNKQYGDIDEQTANIFYGWEIVQIE